MDVFSRTLLPAASEAGVPIPVLSTHLPVLRRCVATDETAVLVASARRPLPGPGGYLLFLTDRRLVVTRARRLPYRVRLHLASRLTDLAGVEWTTGARAVVLAATAPDRVREWFVIPARDPYRARQVDAALGAAFAGPAPAPAALAPAPADLGIVCAT